MARSHTGIHSTNIRLRLAVPKQDTREVIPVQQRNYLTTVIDGHWSIRVTCDTQLAHTAAITQERVLVASGVLAEACNLPAPIYRRGVTVGAAERPQVFHDPTTPEEGVRVPVDGLTGAHHLTS